MATTKLFHLECAEKCMQCLKLVTKMGAKVSVTGILSKT